MTRKKEQTLQELSFEVESYLNSLSYSRKRIKTFQNGWKMIEGFMEENCEVFFTSTVGDDFISTILGKKAYPDLDSKSKNLIRSVNILMEYQLTSTIRYRSVRKSYKFEGEIGNLVQDFLGHRKTQGFSVDTINSNQLYLHRFYSYLDSQKISTFSDLENRYILEFINRLGFYSKATIHCTLSALRIFLKYVFDKGYLEYDLTYLIPKSRYKQEARLPTTYNKNEIERLLAAVDVSSPKGKRDITMILLAARLGLRASDICGLKFENIHWETSTIRLTQKKTKEKIELPLLVELGNAMIEYLKYGRPESDLPYIFLRAGQPYDKLEEPTLHSIVSFYLKRAGINNIDKKKHGPHALRHSLAGILLEKKIPLPVISEVLGHTNTESTKSYLRIDLESLRQCALEVPPLLPPLYQEVK